MQQFYKYVTKTVKAPYRTLKRPYSCSLQIVLMALNTSIHGEVFVCKTHIFLSDMYQSARVDKTKYHRLESFNHRNRFSEFRGPEVQARSSCVSRSLFPRQADSCTFPVFSQGPPSVHLCPGHLCSSGVIFGSGPTNMSSFCINRLFKEP